MIDIDSLMNGNLPTYYKAMLISDYTHETTNGKLIGRLKEDFKSMKNHELIYITYRKELFNFIVNVLKFDDYHVELTPIESRTFKDINDVTKYVRSIQTHMSREVYIHETHPVKMPEVFDNNI
ncbi:MAG: hypothetical protein WCY04_03800 [Bacilli bacterium]|jgi:uncharacterized hydantoinase/oxoprolinase family protein